MTRYHITLEIDADNARDADHYAEWIAENAWATIVRVREVPDAPAVTVEAVAADHAAAFDDAVTAMILECGGTLCGCTTVCGDLAEADDHPSAACRGLPNA